MKASYPPAALPRERRLGRSCVCTPHGRSTHADDELCRPSARTRRTLSVGQQLESAASSRLLVSEGAAGTRALGVGAVCPCGTWVLRDAEWLRMDCSAGCRLAPACATSVVSPHPASPWHACPRMRAERRRGGRGMAGAVCDTEWHLARAHALPPLPAVLRV